MLNVKYHKDLNHNFLIINHKLDEKIRTINIG